MQIEVPAGMIDQGETPMEAALRELKEETGLSAREIVDCGFLYASAGSTTEKMYLFIAYCDDETISTEGLHFSEKIDVEFFSIEQVQKLIDENQINHSALQVLFYRCLSKMRGEKT